MTLPAYAIVTPAKDEADQLAVTAESLIAQTHRPAQWVIVDDGSTDGTLDIAEGYARRKSWISVVSTEDGRTRARGSRVVRAFERGRRELTAPHDVIVKLDGDLYLPPHYFEWVAATFDRLPRAGLVGGRVLVRDGDEWVGELIGRHTVHGAIKAYRGQALAEIGGLRPAMGWDGIDEYALRARGWRVLPLGELHVLHYRQRGSKQRWWKARFEEGRGAHWLGYLPAFVVVRAGYRALVESPPLLGGLALLAGWAASAATGRPRADDPQAVAELRAEQRHRLRRLLRDGASAAPDVPDGGGPGVWKLDCGYGAPGGGKE